MKNKKIISMLVLLFTLCFVPLDIDAHADVSTDTPPAIENEDGSSEDDGIAPCANDIRWMYKSVNGILYRRKYDFTLNKWIGNWERVN